MKESDLKTGIYEGVPFTEYLSWDACSQSGLSVMHQKSPLHYKHYIDRGADTEALRFGRAFHDFVSGEFEGKYAVQPDFGDGRRKETKAQVAVWKEANKAFKWINEKDMSAITGMAKRIEANKYASKIVNYPGAKREVSMLWRDELTGVLCKGRMDLYIENYKGSGPLIADFKTTSSANELEFERSAYKYGYHIQAGMYVEGLESLSGKKNCLPDPPDEDSEDEYSASTSSRFIIIACEKEPPYACNVFNYDTEAISAGRLCCSRALQRVKSCKQFKEWNENDGVRALYLPKYAEELNDV